MDTHTHNEGYTHPTKLTKIGLMLVSFFYRVGLLKVPKSNQSWSDFGHQLLVQFWYQVLVRFWYQVLVWFWYQVLVWFWYQMEKLKLNQNENNFVLDNNRNVIKHVGLTGNRTWASWVRGRCLIHWPTEVSYLGSVKKFHI